MIEYNNRGETYSMHVNDSVVAINWYLYVDLGGCIALKSNVCSTAIWALLVSKYVYYFLNISVE